MIDVASVLSDLDAPLRECFGGDAAAEVARIWEVVRAAWPTVTLAPERYFRFLGERAVRTGSLAKLNAPDLYLACACLDGNRAALSAFDALLDEVGRKLRRLSDNPALLDEGKQIVRRFLMPRGDRLPLLTEYEGRGPLGGWLRMALARELVRLRKSGARDQRLDTAEQAALVDRRDDPETVHLKTHYQREFKEAFAAAFQELEAAERRALRYSIVERLSIDDIARLEGGHRATAARLLARARANLAKKTRRVLSERLDVGAEQLQSILRLIDGEMDMSVTRLLAV